MTRTDSATPGGRTGRAAALAGPPDPAVHARTAPAARVVLRLQGLGAVAARLPFTLGTTATILGFGVLTGVAGGRSLPTTGWWHHVGYGLPALREGRPWTVLFGPLFAASGSDLVLILVSTAVFAGLCEWWLGSRRAAAVVVGTQWGGTLLSAGFLWLLAGHGYGWADLVAADTDAGFSAGGLGAAAAVSALLPALWRWRLRIVLVTFVVVMMVFAGRLSDVEHFWGVVLGLLVGQWLAGSPFRFPRLHVVTVRRARLTAAYLVVLVAAISVVLLFSPGGVNMLGSQSDGSGLAGVVSILLLLLLSDGLRRGRRLAWLLTLLLTLPGTIGLLSGPWTPDAIAQVVVIALLYPVLLVRWDAFRVLPDFARLRSGLIRLAVVASAVAAYAVVGFWVLAGSFAPQADVPGAVQEALDRLSLSGTSDLVPRTDAARVFLGSLDAVGATVLVGTAAALFLSSRRTRRAPSPEEVRGLLVEHGGGNQSWMTTWSGNSYWSPSSSDAYVAYRVIGNVALVLGDPVGSPGGRRTAIPEFGSWAQRRGWAPAFFGVSGDLLDAYRAEGWCVVQVGEDTVIDLPGLEFRGKAWQDVRSAVNNAAKRSITFEFVDLATAPPAITDQLERLSADWAQDKGLPEMGFTLGTLREAADPQVRTAIAVDADRTVHGVTTWLPVYEHGAVRGWTIDVMRRRSGGFRGVMEFLIAQAAVAFREEGYPFLSLSDAPLARREREGQELQALQRVLDRLATVMEPYYGFRSLLAFKAKFQPSYQPAYLVYPDALALPAIGLAITRAYLPDLGIREAVRAGRQ